MNILATAESEATFNGSCKRKKNGSDTKHEKIHKDQEFKCAVSIKVKR